MSFMDEHTVKHVKEELQRMKDPVKLVNFTQEIECMFCRETRELLQEFANLSDKLLLEVYNFQLDSEEVKKFGIDKIPATVILGPNNKDYGIRFFGIPSGYEFGALLEGIVKVSRGDSGLEPGSRTMLKKIDIPLQIMVFVTPTCPFCVGAATKAFQIAVEQPMISASVIEATEFQPLALKYAVFGTPKVVISDAVEFVGMLPEEAFINQIQAAYEKLKGKTKEGKEKD